VNLAYRVSPSDDPKDGSPEEFFPYGPFSAKREDLPYRVELWDEAKINVEQVLAVTSGPGIGFAAYHAATREFPDRYITLSHKRGVVSRWNGPSH
jgi:hypothetical protein